MTDFRALCQELMDAIDSGISTERIKQSPLAIRVDAALAQPEPLGPTDEELLFAYDEFDLADSGDTDVLVRGLRAVLARWGNR
jgi:hypothetical protein